MTHKLLKDGDFARVAVKNYEEYGLNEGNLVYIAGVKPLPVDKTDLYLQRIFVLVSPFISKKLQTEKVLLIDPRSLKPVTKSQQRKYKRKLENQFNETIN